MGINISFPKTPSGHEYVHAVSQGEVSPADAHQLMDLLAPGKPHHDHGLIAVVSNGTTLGAEARKVFSFNDASRNERGIPTAVVVPSAPMRVMMGFIFKMAGAQTRARLFATEGEAVTFVESSLDKN